MTTTNTTKLTIRQAAAQCRNNAHGCALYSDAFSVLHKAYRDILKRSSDPERANRFIELEDLWNWVNGYLEMEEASYNETPLG